MRLPHMHREAVRMNLERIKMHLVAILLVILISSMIVPCLATPVPYLNIKTLFEQSATRWQDVYQSARGETVSVDCPVIIPDADMAPVLRVIWYPPLDQAFLQDSKAPSKADAYKYAAYSKEDTTVFCNNFANTIAVKEIDRCKFVREYAALEEVDWDKAYARNNPLTAREAFGIIESRVKELYTKYGSYGYYPMEPAYGFTTLHLADKDGNPIRDLAAYCFFSHEVIRGLPVLGTVPLTYDHITLTYGDNHEFESLYEPRYYVLNVESEDAYGFAAHLLAEEEVIQEDIPLVDFEIAKSQIERLIVDGRVRKVHGVRLGYILYLEPDHNSKHFRLIPSWVVDCEYYPKAKIDTEVTDEPDYTNHRYFRYMIINAQTGKLIDPESKSPERSNCPEIITWDQIR